MVVGCGVSNDLDLLRAQLIQCTRAMQHAVNAIGALPHVSVELQDIAQGLSTARSAAVDNDKVTAFREGEWQKARQDSERLTRELTEVRTQVQTLQDALRAEQAKIASLARERDAAEQYSRERYEKLKAIYEILGDLF